MDQEESAMATSRTPDIEQRITAALPPRLRDAIDATDRSVTHALDRYGVTALRVALGVVFIWFGALKVAGISPVEELVADTVYWLPAGFVVPAIGYWEIVVGLGLLIPIALRLTLLLFWMQMLGTLLVLVIHPGLAFEEGNPLRLTVIGEFVVKNLVLIAAGLVIGGQVRKRSTRPNTDQAVLTDVSPAPPRS
jgi:uncharacterized membrane protein YkgB